MLRVEKTCSCSGGWVPEHNSGVKYAAFQFYERTYLVHKHDSLTGTVSICFLS